MPLLKESISQVIENECTGGRGTHLFRLLLKFPPEPFVVAAVPVRVGRAFERAARLQPRGDRAVDGAVAEAGPS